MKSQKKKITNVTNVRNDRLERHGLVDMKMCMPNGDLLAPGEFVLLDNTAHNMAFLEYFIGLGALRSEDYEEKKEKPAAPSMPATFMPDDVIKPPKKPKKDE